MSGLTLKIVSGCVLLATFVVNCLANKVTEAQIKEAVDEAVKERLESQNEEDETEEA